MNDKPDHLIRTSAPVELLAQAFDLLGEDTTAKYRLALTRIDKAVVYILKSYLSLPQEISGIYISTRQLEELGDNFPELLHAVKDYAGQKISATDVENLICFHRMKDQRDHQGQAVPIGRRQALLYYELARDLFYRLFGFTILFDRRIDDELIFNFFVVLKDIRRVLKYGSASIAEDKVVYQDVVDFLFKQKVITKDEYDTYQTLKETENAIICHAGADQEMLNLHTIQCFIQLSEDIYAWIGRYLDQKVSKEEN